MLVYNEPFTEAANMTDPPARRALLVDLAGGFSDTGIRRRRIKHFHHALSWMLGTRVVAGVRRLADIIIAVCLILLFSPIFLLLLVAASMTGGGLRQHLKLGRDAAYFYQYELEIFSNRNSRLSNLIRSLPVLYNIVRGDMSFIGPRAFTPRGSMMQEPTAWKRCDLRPGLLSLWWLRRRANIAYTTEIGLDLEYVETNSLRGDLGIAARVIPTLFLGGGRPAHTPVELQFLGVRMHNLTMSEASARIAELARGAAFHQVCFVNADCMNIAYGDKQYRRTLASAELVLADGIGVRIAGRIFNQNIRENINGTDMLPFLCGALEKAGLGLYLLGGRPGVPDEAAAWIRERFPHLRIAGVRHGYFTDSEAPEVLEEISAANADVMLVAFGAPRQDKWIAEHKERLGVKVAIGVGGLLDFYSGRIPRAPVWMRELGMEWFYRFWQEPRRMWRRYFVGNALFLYRVFYERFCTDSYAQGNHGIDL